MARPAKYCHPGEWKARFEYQLPEDLIGVLKETASTHLFCDYCQNWNELEREPYILHLGRLITPGGCSSKDVRRRRLLRKTVLCFKPEASERDG